MIREWSAEREKVLKSYLDLVDNAYNMLKTYYTYDDLMWMPIRDLLRKIRYWKPKFDRIARQQEEERLKMQLEGQRQAKMDSMMAKSRRRRQ